MLLALPLFSILSYVPLQAPFDSMDVVSNFQLPKCCGILISFFFFFLKTGTFLSTFA